MDITKQRTVLITGIKHMMIKSPKEFIIFSIVVRFPEALTHCFSIRIKPTIETK
jgi:hypothetical protein